MDIHDYQFGTFIETFRIPRKELESSSVKTYQSLLMRAGETNDRVSDRAEEAIQKMLQNKEIQALGAIQMKLMEPLKLPSKINPKQVLVRTELVLYMITDLDLAGRDPTRVESLADYGISAVSHTSAAVRKMGEKILLRLYTIDADAVRFMMPDREKDKKNNLAIRRLFDEFDKKDAKMSAVPRRRAS